MNNSDWKKQLAKSYRSAEDLPENFSFFDREREFLSNNSQKYNFTVPEYYLKLASGEQCDPIRRQFMPSSNELIFVPGETGDPLCENRYKVTKRMIHRYMNRVLFIASDTCAMYCRHCFRRNYLSSSPDPLTDKDIQESADYLANHPSIQELIISGGDPLMLEDSRLRELLARFRQASPGIVFRLASRMPVVLPSRITDSLVNILSKFKPIFFITQFNHPVEITDESRLAAASLINSGIPVLNQSVLLKSVNDSVEILAELFQGLIRMGIKPYYLFQGDLAAGTSHLRVPILTGISIMKELRSRISGLAIPVYAVDLPGGGGKIPLTENYINKITGSEIIFNDPLGNQFSYPV